MMLLVRVRAVHVASWLCMLSPRPRGSHAHRWELLATYSAHPSCVCGRLPAHTVRNGAPFCCRANMSAEERVVAWRGDRF